MNNQSTFHNFFTQFNGVKFIITQTSSLQFKFLETGGNNANEFF